MSGPPDDSDTWDLHADAPHRPTTASRRHHPSRQPRRVPLPPRFVYYTTTPDKSQHGTAAGPAVAVFPDSLDDLLFAAPAPTTTARSARQNTLQRCDRPVRAQALESRFALVDARLDRLAAANAEKTFDAKINPINRRRFGMPVPGSAGDQLENPFDDTGSGDDDSTTCDSVDHHNAGMTGNLMASSSNPAAAGGRHQTGDDPVAPPAAKTVAAPPPAAAMEPSFGLLRRRRRRNLAFQ